MDTKTNTGKSTQTRRAPEAAPPMPRPGIALVAPPSDALTQAPPVHLGYLASSLELDGREVRIFDFKRRDTTRAAHLAAIDAWKPGLIGMTAITVEMADAAGLIAELRRITPDAPVVMGGVHPTVLPEQTLSETGADIIVRGEGEKIIRGLVAALSAPAPALDSVRGITYREGGGFKSTPPESPIDNLDSLPFPAWRMLPPAAYSEFTMQLYKRRDVVAPVLTSRGCPHNCAFCASRVHGRKIRSRSAGNAVDEMQLLMRDFAVGEFLILDDNFTSSRRHAVEVCEEIIHRKLDVVWKMPQGMRADTVDDELISLFKRAGCYEVGFGIESANQQILDAAKKKLDLSIIQDKIALIQKHGIEVYGFFILGLPGETRKTAMQTVRFMLRGFDHVSLSFCIPYPGSELYTKWIGNGGVNPGWGKFAHHHIFTGISELTERDLKKFMRIAALRFYLRPSRFRSLARKLKSIPLKHTLNLILKYLGGEKRK